MTSRLKAVIRQFPILAYFVLAYSISWIGCLVTVGPKFIRGEPIQFADALMMFIPMLAGPSIAGIAMTSLVDGRSGLRNLLSRMTTWRIGARWYVIAVLAPPVLILSVLLALWAMVSPAFAPGFVAMGFLVGLLAGFFEEIGWTGYAFPKMELKLGVLAAAVYLGLLHSTWHVAADYLGSSSALGAHWLPHFFAFMTASMTAMRLLIVWVYCNTRSVFLAQLMHGSSTGFLFILGPAALSPADDTLWYAIYAVVLWVVAAIVVATYGKNLSKAVGSL